jgi:hypothetical protein
MAPLEVVLGGRGPGATGWSQGGVVAAVVLVGGASGGEVSRPTGLDGGWAGAVSLPWRAAPEGGAVVLVGVS